LLLLLLLLLTPVVLNLNMCRSLLCWGNRITDDEEEEADDEDDDDEEEEAADGCGVTVNFNDRFIILYQYCSLLLLFEPRS